MGISTLWDLAAAARVPMGIEFEPHPERRPPHSVVEFTASGLRLRDVLDHLVRLDPFYEWREIDGVIVVRPAAAWADPRDSLFSLVPDFHVDDAPMTEVVQAVASTLGSNSPRSSFADSKRLSCTRNLLDGIR